MISFTIPGEPVPKGRHKSRVMWAKGMVLQLIAIARTGNVSAVAEFLRRSLTVSTYTPEKTATAEEAFGWASKRYSPRKPLDGPLRVDTVFVVTPPQKFPPDRSHEWPHIKPDDDNYRKLVLDSMNEIFYHDDSQICGGESFKIYGAPARTFVRIRPLTIEDATEVRRTIGDADENQGALFGVRDP